MARWGMAGQGADGADLGGVELGRAAPLAVDGGRDRLQVGGVDAPPLAAAVVEHHARRDRAAGELEAEAVGQPVPARLGELAVALGGGGPPPAPAAVAGDVVGA